MRIERFEDIEAFPVKYPQSGYLFHGAGKRLGIWRV